MLDVCRAGNPAMHRIRTVMVTSSPLLRDIILQLVASLELVAVLETRDALLERLAGLQPELVVIGLAPDEGQEAAGGIQAVIPRAVTLALAHDLRSAWLFGRDGRRRRLTELSVSGLIAAVQG
jgi:hypothetical protein